MGNTSHKSSNVKLPQTEYNFRPLKYEPIVPLKQHGHKFPIARSGHRIVCDSKCLYSFGGYNPSPRLQNHDIESRPLFREMWKYNFATRKWSKFDNSKTLPLELASNAVIRLNNFLLVYGGTGTPFGERCSNQLYICSISGQNNDMREIETKGQLPLPQYGQALLYHNGYLYTIGGTSGYLYTCDVHRLNLSTQEWENVYICNGQAEYEPKGRYRHEIAFDGRYIYVLGGGTVNESFDLEYIPVFDIELRIWSKWHTIADPTVQKTRISAGIPSPRKCHGAVQIESEDGINVFIIGGEVEARALSDLWKLNLKTLQWTLVTMFSLPHPIFFHSCAVTPEGKLYIFGGITKGGELGRTNRVHATWLCIPKLSEICWEALLHYYPQLNNCCKESLINSGIPRNFVQRLV